MKIKDRLARMGNIFPEKVTMDDIRRMKRRKLTEAERIRPFANHF